MRTRPTFVLGMPIEVQDGFSFCHGSPCGPMLLGTQAPLDHLQRCWWWFCHRQAGRVASRMMVSGSAT
jgi:hypothetical protein